jgi:predicted nucleotidyltransferase
MSQGEHHRIHAHDRVQRNRLRVAQEAARLMTEHGIRDFHHAKLRAAERLGILDTQSLPRNVEIERALREHQRLFLADSQPQLLRQRREAAIEAMRFLAPFEPRLVGAVLEGTADAHSAVCLHVFSDDAEAVELYLRQQGVPVEVQARLLRNSRDSQTEYPVLLFAADQLPFDLTVLSRDALRQAPMDRMDDRPMRRASLVQVEMLLHEDSGDGFEQRLSAALR